MPRRRASLRLGDRWAQRGVRFVRVGYREPNNLDLCAHDLACGREVAGALDGNPLLLFHGDRDEWLPSVLFPS